ncbi:PEP-CTERM sorting domain-containing protein [Kiritimatiellaeota bacterium B1221]|nr:PEP-CTERM sorting domain-containing protein [Kiritimatiellaeota bacterium B1221]
MHTFKYTFVFFVSLCFVTLLGAAKIEFMFSPTLTGGTDPNGLENATWLFEFEVTQPTYQLSGTFDDISFSSESAQLTITGATNAGVNGVHAISSADVSGDFVFIPEYFGSTLVALEGPDNSSSSFSFAGINVSNFNLAAVSFGSPMVGDSVDVTPYNTITFSSSTFNTDNGNFSFTPVGIPEPSQIFLLVLGGFLCIKLRHKVRS